MEIALFIAIVLLAGFAVLALFDGVYLHLYRYRLYAHRESRNEHITHTLRALLFPAILYFLYLGHTQVAFYTGLSLVAIDLFVLGMDAYMEKDSRAFMGGLPRWEYILHLAVNGLHFASIAVFLIIRIRLGSQGWELSDGYRNLEQYGWFKTLAEQLIPGGIIVGLLHVFLLLPARRSVYKLLASKLKCCSVPENS